jgi:hypothetical protein
MFVERYTSKLFAFRTQARIEKLGSQQCFIWKTSNTNLIPLIMPSGLSKSPRTESSRISNVAQRKPFLRRDADQVATPEKCSTPSYMRSPRSPWAAKYVATARMKPTCGKMICGHTHYTHYAHHACTHTRTHRQTDARTHTHKHTQINTQTIQHKHTHTHRHHTDTQTHKQRHNQRQHAGHSQFVDVSLNNSLWTPPDCAG